MAYQTTLQSKTMELFVAYQRQPSIHLRNQLVRLNIGLVRKVAHRLSCQCKEPYEDLEQCGSLGLIAAIERFDPTQGYAFSSYAVPYIRGEILHFLRDRSNTVRIPRRWQQLYQDSQKVRQSLMAIQGHQPSDQDIAAELGLPLKEWLAVKIAATNRVPLSLELQLGSRSNSQIDASLTLGDTLPDISDQVAQCNQEESLELLSALDQLEEKARESIQLVFLNQLTRQAAAQQIGVSPVTVTRRVAKGLKDLREILEQRQSQVEIAYNEA